MTPSTGLGPGPSTTLRASEFRRRVLAAARRIPAGRVTTYGDLAALAGRPRAARAVGNIMRDAREAGIPYHRVIAAGGALGGYGGSLQLKRELLRAEGIWVGMTRVRGFVDVRWKPVAAKGTRTAVTTKATKNK